MRMNELIFLTTQDCTLCDQALDVVLRHPSLAGMQLRVIDVMSDDELFTRYGHDIPLIAVQVNGQLLDGCKCLCWPFDNEAISDWLHKVDYSTS
tara:strand:+ start:86 stop:367 length:282 start_codon:yes stop_codon:yes gene_type:complete